MFCEKCGNPIGENERFCAECGTPVPENMSTPIPVEEKKEETVDVKPADTQPKVEQPKTTENQPKAAPKTIKVNKKTLIFGGIGGAVALAIIVLIATLSSMVKPDKFINDNLIFEGYDGYAYIAENSVIDYEGLYNELGRNTYYDMDYNPLYEFIEVTYDKQENLKNGDTVTATIKFNYDYINSRVTKKKLSGKDVYEIEFEVSNLPEPVVIDPFQVISSVTCDKTNDDVTVNYQEEFNKQFGEFTLTVGDGYYSKNIKILDADGYTLETIYYDYDELSEDGKLTVTVDCEENMYASKGLIISPVSKEYTPKTIDFIRTAKDISADSFKTLKDAAVKEFGKDRDNTKYVKAYFGYDPEGNGGREHFWYSKKYNSIRFVFSFKEDDETTYRSVVYYDVKIDSDGKLDANATADPKQSSDYGELKNMENYLVDIWEDFVAISVK